MDALSYIKQSLANNTVLAIGEAHWFSELFTALSDCLLDPQLDGAFTHLFVEFGNSKHQTLLNSYLAGEAVSEAELATIWLDSVAFPAWLHPCYGHFFQQVREVNALRQYPIRVLLTEPEFDWNKVTSTAQLKRINAQRDQALLDAIQHQQQNSDQGVIVLLGARHIVKRSPVLGRFSKYKTFGDLAHQAFSKRYICIWPHMLSDNLETKFGGGLTEQGIYQVGDSPLGKTSFVEVLPQKPRINPYGFTTLDKLIDAYWYLGPQTRRLDPSIVMVTKEWRQHFERRLPYLSEGQKRLVSGLIN